MNWRNAPEITLNYGLNVFFNPKAVGLAFEDGVSGVPVAVRAPEGVIVLALGEALRRSEYVELLTERFTAEDGREEKISSWHRANVGNGVVIHVPADYVAASPIRIDLVLDSDLEKPGALHQMRRVENVIIIAEEGSRFTVVEHLRSTESIAPASSATQSLDHSITPPLNVPTTLRSSITDIIALPNSQVTHISLQDFSSEVTDLSSRRAIIGRDASVTWLEGLFGGGFSQSRVTTMLVESGASTNAKSVFFGRDSQKFDLHHDIRHLASQTTSDLRIRGALSGRAKAIVRGLIHVATGTKGCVGNQKEDVLLLSPTAEVDTIPNLEIGTDDVRCGHGATVGRLNAEKMFYLMSRGFDQAAARRFLVEGFFATALTEMHDAGLGDSVECLIAERASAMQDSIQKT